MSGRPEDSPLYEALLEAMTTGFLSGSGGAMGAGAGGMYDTNYRTPLAKAIAAETVFQLGNPTNLSTEQIQDVKNGLALKLSEFGTREETAEAFGWKENRMGGHATQVPQQLAAAAFASDLLLYIRLCIKK